MRILFSSDLHGLLPAYDRFARLLRRYDAGIIAGDLRDPYVPQHEIADLFGLTEDDFLDELPSPEDKAEDIIARAVREAEDPSGYLMRALQIKENEIKQILKAANRPIFLVPGNHDRTCWESDGFIQNIHERRIDLQNYNFVGYRYSNNDRREEDQQKDMARLAKLMDNRTILVTHGPPYGVLDLNANQEHLGSRALSNLLSRKTPYLHLFGHVHEGFGLIGRAINGCYPPRRRFIGINLEGNTIRFVQ